MLKHAGFRPEIQALRALAVLSVVAYHLEPSRVPGGFVGVDVFFVISGYLITGHMLREVAATGTLSLRSFWGARARRILPAALAVIVVVLAAAVLLGPPTQWPQLGRQALASAFYLQNWVLAADSVDYSAAGQAATALQHYWSLAVEEQFYLCWPLLVLLAAAAGRRSGRPAARRAVPLFAAAAAGSLACGLWLTASGNPAAYFITPARIWELASGGLLAAAPPGAAPHRHLRSGLALAGLSAIAASVFLFNGGTPFPGVAALLPVAGALAVIAAGRTCGAVPLRRLVELKPVQCTGNISYSLYLWHWPLIVFYKTLAEKDPGPVQSLALLAASTALAALSFHLVEAPARNSAWLRARAWRPLVAGAAATALAASLSFVPSGLHRQILAERAGQAAQLRAAPPARFGAAAMTGRASRTYAADSTVIIPDPGEAGADRADLDGCTAGVTGAETPECAFGDPRGSYTVALVGDSHAGHWFPALERTARKNGWRLLTYLHNSCPFNPEKRTLEAAGQTVCTEPNRQTLRRLTSRGDIDAVVTSYYAESEFAGSATGRRPGAAGFARYWNALADAGIGVYPVVDTPRPRDGAAASDCVARHYTSPWDCDQPRSAGLDGKDLTRAAARLAPRAQVVDLSSRFCGTDTCPAVVGNVLVYRDSNHVSGTYMATLAPALERALLAAMARNR